MSDEVKALLDRLDKQAKAIRALEKRITALEAAGATSSTPTSQPVPGHRDVISARAPRSNPQGEFVPEIACLECGATKPPSRTALTCKPCGLKYSKSIKGTGPRMLYPACLNCGATKTTNIAMLCKPCSHSFTKWKAEN